MRQHFDRVVPVYQKEGKDPGWLTNANEKRWYIMAAREQLRQRNARLAHSQ